MIAEISVITLIAVTAVTVDIVAPAGRGRHERAARTARAAAVSVRRRRTMTNQAIVAAQTKEARRELLQIATRARNNHCGQQPGLANLNCRTQCFKLALPSSSG